eukprot:TRINITY_DN5283_c0_g1_i10.p2 TRINITY_DN5283_c0_g1~~TRINITY_DN5283_c0_g1_i10.p2  ORF type:complete len:203 (-),score=-19.02 TRINITY_DN5283_c0_g1_i10:260-868(-)
MQENKYMHIGNCHFTQSYNQFSTIIAHIQNMQFCNQNRAKHLILQYCINNVFIGNFIELHIIALFFAVKKQSLQGDKFFSIIEQHINFSIYKFLPIFDKIQFQKFILLCFFLLQGKTMAIKGQFLFYKYTQRSNIQIFISLSIFINFPQSIFFYFRQIELFFLNFHNSKFIIKIDVVIMGILKKINYQSKFGSKFKINFVIC